MNVTATDKGTSKNAKITITNNKGRLSKDEIERLIKDAEKYKDADEKIRKRVEAKNALESYCVSVKHTLDDEKLKDKFDASEKSSFEAKVRETETWLSSNPEADTV
jgi:heat shock 70kDa protein 1/2/6/8